MKDTNPWKKVINTSTPSLSKKTQCILHVIWVNYNISLTWIKAIWGYFPLLTMIPVRSQWGRYNLPRCYDHSPQLHHPLVTMSFRIHLDTDSQSRRRADGSHFSRVSRYSNGENDINDHRCSDFYGDFYDQNMISMINIWSKYNDQLIKIWILW